MPQDNQMISLDAALDIVERELANRMLPCETVSVRQALGRIITEDQVSRLDLPPFNKSAMDGYAVLENDIRPQYRLLETVAAGQLPCRTLEPGTAVKVMTGAPVPEGAGRVIMIEQTAREDETIRVFSHSKETHICPKGQDVRRGDIILKAPAVCGPLEIANLVSAGITEIKAARPVKIAILATGDEIVDSPDLLSAGKIMNSNGPLLEALCRTHHLEVTSVRTVPDEEHATAAALNDAFDRADIVVLSGGVSAGDFDWVPAALEHVGFTLHFNRLAVKPGKPMTFASSNNKITFGLPGNPVAVFLMFHLFVLYAARLLCGLSSRPRTIHLPLAADLRRRKADRTAFIPCRLTAEGTLCPVEYHGTAHLRALLESDGFLIVDAGQTDISAGHKMRFMSIRDNFA